jgi:hypothetical protein
MQGKTQREINKQIKMSVKQKGKNRTEYINAQRKDRDRR